MSLTIYNELTEEDITKGRKIVGTGTIDIHGKVGESLFSPQFFTFVFRLTFPSLPLLSPRMKHD